MNERNVTVTQFLKKEYLLLTGAVVLMFIQIMGTLYIPTLMSSIVNDGILKGDMMFIYKAGARMVGIAFLTSLVSLMGAWIASTVAGRWCRDIRKELFSRVMDYSVNDFKKFGTASIITRTTNDVTQMQDTLAIVLQLVLPAPVITIGALILAYGKHPSMAVLLFLMTLVFVGVACLLCLKALPFYEALRNGMDSMNRVLRERITGVRVIRAFNKEPYEREKMNGIFEDYGNTSIRVNKIFAVMMPLVLAVSNLCVLAILWFGGKIVVNGGMAIGDIMALIEYAMLIFWNLVMGVMMMLLLPRAKACATRIHQLLVLEPEIEDGKDRFRRKNNEAVLEFSNVTFQYENAEEPVLYDLNFTCRKGETTAIIGGTGSGKSTIASLMMRFFDIRQGKIMMYGNDIKDMSQDDLRGRIGYVPQKAFLFSGTIKDNLLYGDSDADQGVLEKAISIAQAESFIGELEHGMDSYVAQGGMNFSGGQKQRLSIARALTRKADLYIFDDSFSALDYKTDAELRRALKREVKDSAIVVVAQRVSSIVDADQIIVLEKGRVAGIGTHEELVSNCLVYQEIVNSQRKGEEAI